MDTPAWKLIAINLLTTIRVLFVATITWDFFLTVVVKSSQRAHVLMGPAAVFAPFIIILWMIVIIGLSYLIFDLIRMATQDSKTEKNKKHTAYVLLTLTVVLYIFLAVLAFVNPVVTYPVVVNFVVNLVWAVAMFYFRARVQRLLESDDAE